MDDASRLLAVEQFNPMTFWLNLHDAQGKAHPLGPGRSGYPRPAAVAGHNMPNLVVLSTGLKAGDKFQIAIFGINGPISVAPANSVFVRDAKLELFK